MNDHHFSSKEKEKENEMKKKFKSFRFYCVQLLFKWLCPVTGCYWTHGMGWREEAEVEGEWQRKPPDCDKLTLCATLPSSQTQA